MNQLQPTSNVVAPIAFQKAQEIPEQLVTIAKCLSKLPPFSGESPLSPIHLMNVEDVNDAKLCEIFSRKTRQILHDEVNWHLFSVGIGYDQLYDASKHCVGKGVYLFIKNPEKQCSQELLNESYQKVLGKLQTCWVAAKPEEHKNIVYAEDSHTYSLFIEKNSFREAKILVNIIASKLQLQEDVKCYAAWKSPGGGEKYDKAYMYIRTSSLENVTKLFGFQLRLS